MKILSFAGHIPVPDPRINRFNIYRKRGTGAFTRIAQIPIQLEYQDPDGITGDAYYFTYFDDVRFAESGPSPIIVASDSMDTVTVTGFAVGIDGLPLGQDPVSREFVEVLVQLQGLSLAAPVADGQIIMSIKQSVLVDAAGRFFFEVPANDRIYPSETYYKIQYLDRQFFKTVKSTRGKGQLLADLDDVPPVQLR